MQRLCRKYRWTARDPFSQVFKEVAALCLMHQDDLTLLLQASSRKRLCLPSWARDWSLNRQALDLPIQTPHAGWEEKSSIKFPDDLAMLEVEELERSIPRSTVLK